VGRNLTDRAIRRGGGEGCVEAEFGAVEEGGEFGEAEGEAFLGGGAEGDMGIFSSQSTVPQ
jgi:hypothetical protein